MRDDRASHERPARRSGLGGIILVVATVSLLSAAAIAAAGFDDDDGNVHEPAIDALAGEGILEGTECGEGAICPREPFERWVMAVWLIRALGESPSTAANRFVDVDAGAWWAPYVERLAELNVTLGCATESARYCPEEPVRRGQMATFLVRAFDLEAGPDAGFVDTAGHTHTAGIDALAAAGITAGCADEPARYCPGRPVTRGQTATFVARALGLVPLPARPADPFGAVAVGRAHSCALRLDGTVACWGDNSRGQAEAPGGPFTAITAGDWHSCGLRTGATVDCWGDNRYGQLDIPEARFTAVAAGAHHTCALGVDGTITCRGGNLLAQANAA